MLSSGNIYMQVTQVTMLLSNSTIVTAPLALLLYLWPVLPSCGTAALYLHRDAPVLRP